MRSIRKSGITALTAAIALSLGAVPVALTVPSIVAADDGTTTVVPATLPAGYVAAGHLQLATAPSSASATLFPAGATVATASQTFAAANCTPLTTDGADLLDFLGEGINKGTIEERPVGLLKGAFGVQDKGTGTSCGRADSGTSESLTLSLGDNAAGVLGALVSSARLDLDMKGGARVTATATGPAGSFQRILQSGTPQAGDATNPIVENCSPRSDSGPDSGANDNCTWTITPPTPATGQAPKYFTSLKLQANAGSFALSGGSDYVTSSAANVSRFELVQKVDGTLNCDSATVTRSSDGTTPEVTVRRLAVNANGEACERIPYTLTNNVGTSGTRFLKPLDVQTTAQFVADFVWTTTPTSGTTSLPPTKVNFETPSAATDITIGWCPDPLYDGTILIGGVTVPKLVGIANPLSSPDLDTGTGALAGIQFACVGVQNTTVDPTTDKVRTVEQVYILGDIKTFR